MNKTFTALTVTLVLTIVILALANVLMLTTVVGQKNADKQKADVEEAIKNYIKSNPQELTNIIQAQVKKAPAPTGAAPQVDDKKAEAEVIKRTAEIYNNPTSAFIGNPNGKTLVVEFFDYNCHYCKGIVPDLVKLINDNKDVKVIFKEMAILGPTSSTTAIAALAAHDIAPQKYFEFHSALMAKKGPADDASIAEAAKSVGIDVAKLTEKMKDKKYADILAKNMELAQSLSIRGTPAFIINGKFTRGAIPYDKMKELIAAKK